MCIYSRLCSNIVYWWLLYIFLLFLSFSFILLWFSFLLQYILLFCSFLFYKCYITLLLVYNTSCSCTNSDAHFYSIFLSLLVPYSLSLWNFVCDVPEKSKNQAKAFLWTVCFCRTMIIVIFISVFCSFVSTGSVCTTCMHIHTPNTCGCLRLHKSILPEWWRWWQG